MSRFNKLLAAYPMSPTGSYPLRVRVKLKDDLTRYHASLRRGVEGTTVPPTGRWARDSNRFCSVQFPEVVIDVLWGRLEIVDVEYKKLEQEAQAIEDESIRMRTTGAIWYVGQRKAFRSFTVTYIDETGMSVNNSWGDRRKADRIRKILEAVGYPIETKVL